MERRDFLKGLGLLLAAPVVAKIPMALPKKESAFAPTGMASAWVCFDGKEPTIEDSYNVSGIKEIGEGQYIIAFDKPVNDYVVNAHPMARLDYKNSQGFSVETFSGKAETMTVSVFS